MMEASICDVGGGSLSLNVLRGGNAEAQVPRLARGGVGCLVLVFLLLDAQSVAGGETEV